MVRGESLQSSLVRSVMRWQFAITGEDFAVDRETPQSSPPGKEIWAGDTTGFANVDPSPDVVDELITSTPYLYGQRLVPGQMIFVKR